MTEAPTRNGGGFLCVGLQLGELWHLYPEGLTDSLHVVQREGHLISQSFA